MGFLQPEYINPPSSRPYPSRALAHPVHLSSTMASPQPGTPSRQPRILKTRLVSSDRAERIESGRLTHDGVLASLPMGVEEEEQLGGDPEEGLEICRFPSQLRVDFGGSSLQ